MNALLYVYGTLRKGASASLADDLYVATGVRIPGRIHDLGSFPGYVEDGDSSVVCDIVNISDPDLLHRLDRYEGYRASDPATSLYVRVALEDGNQIYVYNNPINPRIHTLVANGDWISYYATKRQTASAA